MSCFSISSLNHQAPLSISFIKRPSSMTTSLLPFTLSPPPRSQTVLSCFSAVSMRLMQSVSVFSLFATYQGTAKLQNPGRSQCFKYRCYTTMHIQPVIHCVASTTAKPHSLVRHNFQGNTPRLGLMLFTEAVVSAISSSLKITEIYSESQNRALWL